MTRPTRPLWKRIARGLAAAFGVLLLLVAALAGYLHSADGQERLRARVEQRIGERITTKARLEGLRFSFGDGLTLEHLHVQGNDGNDAIVVDRVNVVPAWRRLVHGEPALAALELDGLHVTIVGKDDGTNNLTGLAREGKPLEHLILENVRVQNVTVDSRRPDGTVLAVRGVSLQGPLEIRPRVRTVDTSLELGVAALTLDKPGLHLALTDLTTRARVQLTEGVGPITIGPSKGHAQLERPEQPPFAFDLGLGPATTTLGNGDLRFAAEAIELAVLSLAAVRVETHREGDALRGPQRASTEKLVVSAEAVNRLAGKPLLAGNVGIGIDVQGPPEALRGDVTIETQGGTITLAATVDTTAKPLRYQLELRTHDLQPRKIVALERVPESKVGELLLEAKGQGTSAEQADVGFHLQANDVSARGVTLERAELRGRVARGTVQVDSLQLDAVGQHVDADASYELASHQLRARVTTRGSVQTTLAALKKAGVKTPQSPALANLSVRGPVTVRVEGDPRSALRVQADELNLGLAGGSIHVRGNTELAAAEPGGRLRPGPVQASVRVRGVSLAAIGRLRGKPLPVDGTLDADVQLQGNAAAPNGAVDLDVKFADDAGALTLHGTLRGGALDAKATLSHKPSGVEADLTVDGAQRAGSSALHARGSVKAGSTPAAKLDATATIAGPLTALKTAPVKWQLDLALPDTEIDALPLPAATRQRLADVHGTVGLHVRANGNKRDAFATADVRLHHLRKGVLGALDAELHAELADSTTTVKLVGKLEGSTLATLDASADVGGRDLFSHLRRGLDPRVHAELDVPERPLRELHDSANGVLAAHLALDGRARDPQLDGRVQVRDVSVLDGSAAELHLDLKGSFDALRATLGGSNGVQLEASASPRAFLEAKRQGGVVPIAASLRATRAPLLGLLPDLPMLRPYRGVKGLLDADLRVHAELELNGEERHLRSIDLRGPMRLGDGVVMIPQSSRVVDGIELRLEGHGEELRVARLEAHEHDRDVRDRRVQGEGSVSLRDRSASFDLELHDVLVHGGSFGAIDAPRAALSGKLRARAELGSAPKRVDVTVDSLELTSPDRFLRAHQQEALSLGDVVELAGTEVGVLQRQAPLPVAKPAGPRGEKTLQVDIHIANTVHIKQKPLELYARGEVHIERYGDERVLSGALTPERGSLLIGGVEHTFDHGEVRMDQGGAFMDLHFRHDPAPAAQRDFASANGTTVYAHMMGPFGKQKVSVSGRADSLFDALAINNGGRARVLTAPEAPASQTAQLPQVREIRLTAYMAANLPHLAFMTRVNTYADPSVNQFAYGRFQNLEAERYTQDGRWRLRTTRRPPVVGQSEAEVEYDRLFLNTPRVVSGVGLLGGTRVGGGPTVFWEWSSAD